MKAPGDGSLPIVVCHGRLAPGKGVETLLAAAATVASTHGAIDLRLYGDGEMKEELMAAAEEFGWPTTIFRGFAPDIPSVLAEADICVQPSLREGMSIALIETMRAGRCVVASDIPANLEALGVPPVGFIFRAGDVADLSRALTEGLANAAQRQHLAMVARARYERLFDESRMLREYADLYATLVRLRDGRETEVRVP
jgi:glycosyltransferase involved in cell wall biosynthesis